jgi:hypothetical protein
MFSMGEPSSKLKAYELMVCPGAADELDASSSTTSPSQKRRRPWSWAVAFVVNEILGGVQGSTHETDADHPEYP